MTINNSSFDASFMAAVLYSTRLEKARLQFDGEFWQFCRGGRVYKWIGPIRVSGNKGFFPLDHHYWDSRSIRGREHLVRVIRKFEWHTGYPVHRPGTEKELTTGKLPDPPDGWSIYWNGTFVEYGN